MLARSSCPPAPPDRAADDTRCRTHRLAHRADVTDTAVPGVRDCKIHVLAR